MTAVASGAAREAHAVGCAHCGLPVPAGMVQHNAEEQYCCVGCEAARAAIVGCGLDAYYAMRTDAEPAPTYDDAFTAFDAPAFLDRYATALEGGACEARLRLQGVHCVACLWLLEKLPKHIEGLLSLELDLGRSVAVVRWDPVVTPLSKVARALARFGYPPTPVEASSAASERSRRERRQLAELGVAAGCMGNVMLLAFAMYSGKIEAPYDTLFGWLSAGLGVLSVAWPGRVFFRGAYAAWRARAWHLDAPIALALGLGTLGGLINVARGVGEIYFDSLTMLVLLLLIGRWLQSRQQHRATEAIELLFSVTPRTVRKVAEDGSVQDVPSDAVEVGDLVEVLAERSVPVDGVIESGASSFDESALTGEANPIKRGVGDVVAAGTTNLSSAVRVRVGASGRETRIGQILETVERLSSARTPLVGSAERLAKPFLLGVLGLSAVCLGIHVWFGVEKAFEHTVALVIVVCPCALSIATPLATSFAIGRLARSGILVKGGDVLEALAGSPRAIFDKTGTLTDGRFEVRETFGDDSVWPIVAAMETSAQHPVGRAMAAFVARDADAFSADGLADVEVRRAMGVVGVYRGDRYAVGSERMMAAEGIEFADWLASHGAGAVGARVLVARNGQVVAEARLGDAVRPETAECLESLRAHGWEAMIASGDAKEPVGRVAGELKIERAEAAMSPEDKAAMVESLQRDESESSRARPIVFVGDGVNDAASLAGADVGIAVHGGAEASMAAADVYLSRGGLSPFVELVEAARGVTRRVKLCLGLAAGYNLVAASLALAGLISPIVAAVLMPLSSLTVLTVALGGFASARGAAGSKR